MGIAVVGTYTDLNRPLGDDETFAHGVKEHCAVIDAAVLVFPGVRMGVEMDERQGAEAFGVGAKQGQGHEVIPAQG